MYDVVLVVSFVRWYVSSQGRVVMRNFVVGRFVLGRIVLGRFVFGRFALGRFVLGRFVLGRIVSRTFLFVELLCLYHPVWCMDSTSLFDPYVKMTLHQAVVQCVGRVECGHFFGSDRTGQVTKGQV